MSTENDYILHLINCDQFTTGYINFMNIYLPEYNHYFFSNQGRFEITPKKSDIFYSISSITDFIKNKNLRRLVLESSKIIISGFFGGWIQKIYLLFPANILNKTYIQYWGGDFYDLRNKTNIIPFKSYIAFLLKKYIMRKCTASIFLLESESEPFEKITGIKKRHFVAPMPGDPLAENLLSPENLEEPVYGKVIVGHSATRENHHKEVFDILSTWKNEISVWSPLSYGDKEYADETIEIGRKTLGDSFSPVASFMEKKEYMSFLSTFSVGIYYCDRQQALGNIYALFEIGRKVYLRKGTSMWNQFQKDGFVLHDVDNIKNETLEEFLFISEEEKKNNKEAMLRRNDVNKVKQMWKNIFDDDSMIAIHNTGGGIKM